ncbi:MULTISPECIES: DNA-3-methyladenine glycosylase family protein [Psychrilyobacter]|uniref:DNA-3-methyladenine glycosylase II n=1 Tax=Psychrilyobacter piezotolerans TaxID=2293438 RepID=A0ABX9KIE2_9FUSO|nr:MULTISPECIES: DNA-3-methyladenine glycosylase [Psychrilyobacter]MCS5420311.1 DNA-3-methyladenine glycosylase [Psychrilyobacter sp. S5]NDI77337.1 DNA-3-methyladenine glycosylase 2 family protein [Psychrilyobacter piezotolerans]RDE63385.1 DNA-3-methyladenine glycosylase 2 family protein [Psychrilyobacter sp. S5]REI41927.1 DNA-3-methyladenine glycosylase 2 family protein [Psychrilyobacter piezotolerans]
MNEKFEITDRVIEHLKSCERMAFLIDHFGRLEERSIVKDPFMGMIYNIIYQQISFASGNAIWKRWDEKYGDATPEFILAAGEEELRSCGLSKSKASYVKNLAKTATKDRRLLNRESLKQMTEAEIYDLYIPIKGIGPWSVKMFLIFTLGRTDVRSYGDLALKKGVEWVYGEENITEKRYMELTDKYSPYNTVASFYFWEITVKKLLKKSPDFDNYMKGI